MARPGDDGGVLTALRRRLLARPGRAAFIIASVGLTMGVFINALTLQNGAHPNPMFGGNRPVTVMAHPPAAARPQPVKPPVAQPQQPAAREVPAGPAAAPAPGHAPRRQDAIGDLLRGGTAPAPPPRPVLTPSQPAQPAAPPKPQPVPQVMSAQKALGKLGFGALNADGLMGPGTRAAIERFEKARGLPVTGELNPRTLKALGAAAGAPIR